MQSCKFTSIFVCCLLNSNCQHSSSSSRVLCVDGYRGGFASLYNSSLVTYRLAKCWSVTDVTSMAVRQHCCAQKGGKGMLGDLCMGSWRLCVSCFGFLSTAIVSFSPASHCLLPALTVTVTKDRALLVSAGDTCWLCRP